MTLKEFTTALKLFETCCLAMGKYEKNTNKFNSANNKREFLYDLLIKAFEEVNNEHES